MSDAGRPARPIQLVAFIIVSVMLIILDTAGQLTAVKGIVMTPLLPLQQGLVSVGQFGESMVQTVRDLNSLRQRNEGLQELADRLTIENVRLREIETEAENLRRLLRFRQTNPNLDVRGGQIIGRILGRDPNQLQYLMIDLGSNQGITAGMPVMSDVGLVGRITEVTPEIAKVLLITDPDSAVNALIQGSRLFGVVEGSVGNFPRIRYLSQDAKINPGDIVLTSGLGGNLPKGLTIGQIVSVRKRDFEMFQEAEVRPTVDFERLETVLVITNFRSNESPPIP